jgi:tRNA-2-methylthio-N6-dimethylallyladenosine synthase
MDEQVGEVVKRERLERLQAVLDDGHGQFNGASVGKTMPVLFEKAGRNAGQLVGRTPYLQLVQAEAGPEFIGEIVDVEIQTAGANSLSGVIRRST